MVLVFQLAVWIWIPIGLWLYIPFYMIWFFFMTHFLDCSEKEHCMKKYWIKPEQTGIYQMESDRTIWNDSYEWVPFKDTVKMASKPVITGSRLILCQDEKWRKKTFEYVKFNWRENGTASLAQWEISRRNNPDLVWLTLVRIYRLTS